MAEYIHEYIFENIINDKTMCEIEICKINWKESISSLCVLNDCTNS